MRLALFSLVALIPGAIGAQYVVQVVDERGAPVPAAHVELWSATERVSARLTTENGFAVFQSSESTRARAALIRKIGFGPSRLPIGAHNDTLVALLRSLQGSLPSVTVVAASRACPQADDAAARGQWEAATARYRTPSLHGRKANVETRRTTVDAEQVGAAGDGTPTTGWRLYTLSGMIGARNGIAHRGYVLQLAGPHTYEDFGVWRYRPLHAELAGHFVDSLFGARHTMSVDATDSQISVIRFCARSRRGSGLDGTLRIDATGALVDARWSYWNPMRGAEWAGGEVVFAPPPEFGIEPLFAASGLFWRRLPSGRYLQNWQRFAAWELLADSFSGGK